MIRQQFMVNLSQSMRDHIKETPGEILEREIKEMICKGTGLEITDMQLKYAIGPEQILFVIYTDTQEKADKIKEFFDNYKPTT